MTEDFSREISHLITRLERTKKTALREVLAKYDLRLSHSLCLAYIERHPGTRQDDIAAWLVVDKGSVARNAAKHSTGNTYSGSSADSAMTAAVHSHRPGLSRKNARTVLIGIPFRLHT